MEEREKLSPRYAARCFGSRLPGIPQALSRKVYSSRYRQKFLSDCEGFLRCGAFAVLQTILAVCKTLPRHAVLRAAAVDAHRRITRCTIDAPRLVLKGDLLGVVSGSPQERPIADRDGDRDQVDGFGTRGPVAWVSGELADLVVTGAFASSSASSLKSNRRWASSLTRASCLPKIFGFSRCTKSSMAYAFQG
jgi:hypothetical protein